MPTKRGDRQRRWNQRKRASDLLTYLVKKRLVTGDVTPGAVNAIQNWLQREHRLGRVAQ